MAIEELQVLLGLLKTDENGEAILEEPKYTAAGDAEFPARRQVRALEAAQAWQLRAHSQLWRCKARVYARVHASLPGQL